MKMHKTIKNGQSLFFFFIDWRKDAIMFLWPLEKGEKEIAFFPWLAKLLKMDESPILIRSMTGIIICSDSSVIFFPFPK